MENIKFNDEKEMKDYFSKLIILGSGCEGTCYKNKGFVYKMYNREYIDLYSNEVAIERLLKFRDIIIENIYFIRGLICLDSVMVGSVSEYACGSSCVKRNLYRCKIDNLAKALTILKENVYELGKLGICLDDIFLGNILYDGDKFKLIDTGSYYYYKEMPDVLEFDELIIYKKNMKKIMRVLLMNITNGEVDKFILSFLWGVGSPYRSYLVDNDLLCNPDETIIGIKNTISEYIGYEIDSFSNCKKDLLKLRKIK